MRTPKLLASVAVVILTSVSCSPTKSGEAASPAAAEPVKPPKAALLVVPPEVVGAAGDPVSQAAIDIVNEAVAAEKGPQGNVFRVKAGTPLWIRGWAYDEAHKKSPSRVWIELTGQQAGQRFFIPAERVERPDVVKGFKVPWAGNCGFASAVVQDHNIPRGSYDIKLYQSDGENAVRTRYYAVPAVTVIFE